MIGGVSKTHTLKSLPKIVSGGQTGADRAALDWALERGLACGGWCPKGRKAEDGVIDAQYPLRESSSGSYLQRTEWNVRDSDGTVVFSLAPKLTCGSLKTVEFARKHNRPLIHGLRCGSRPCWPAATVSRGQRYRYTEHCRTAK